jgi:hypothetical protein
LNSVSWVERRWTANVNGFVVYEKTRSELLDEEPCWPEGVSRTDEGIW